MPSRVVTCQGGRLVYYNDKTSGLERMTIFCRYFGHRKEIEGIRFNLVFWISKDQLFDIIFRHGFDEKEWSEIYDNPPDDSSSSSTNFSTSSRENSFCWPCGASDNSDDSAEVSDGYESEPRAIWQCAGE